MAQLVVANREELYDALDRYAYERRAEIDRRDLGADTGLIKSYVLETSRHDGAADIPAALAGTGLRPERLGDGDVFTLFRGGEHLGYAEPLGGRHLAVHSYMQNTRQIDETMRRLVRRTPALDALWLAGETFHQLLRQIVAPLSPQRNTIVKCAYVPEFATPGAATEDVDEDDLPWATSPAAADAGLGEDTDPDKRVASLMERAGRLARNLPRYQAIDPAWRAIRTMRIPGVEHGGYDLYSWGKLTHRAASFTAGRGWLRDITAIYERATRAIEELVWLAAEPTRLPGDPGITLRGAPVVCRFPEPLPDAVFRTFVAEVFERGEGTFRLWGEPLRLGERKVHVYGVDLHLFQQLYMELTPRHFTFILPAGTCGNTVHRLMTNLQRAVDPAVTMTVGDTDYAALLAGAIRHQGAADA
jgi:hypothetical protein